MTTPPRPTPAEYEDALHRIHHRRRAAGDDHPLALSEDPREVLAYLRRRGRTGLIADDTGDDVVDALILRLWLFWEGESAELWLLEAAEKLGRNRKEVGSVLGLGSGQGLVDRIKRKRDALDRTVSAGESVAASNADADIRALAVALVDHRGEMPEDVVDDLHLGQVGDALTRWPPGAPAPTRGALHALRFLLGDLVDVVPAGTPLRAVVDHGVELIGARTACPKLDLHSPS